MLEILQNHVTDVGSVVARLTKLVHQQIMHTLCDFLVASPLCWFMSNLEPAACLHSAMCGREDVMMCVPAVNFADWDVCCC